MVSNLSGLVLGALRGIHLAYFAAWLLILGTLLQLVTVIILVPTLGLAGLAWGQIIQHVTMLIVGWVLFRHQLGKVSGMPGPLLPVRFDKGALREMFSFSVKAQVANLANGFFEPLSKILISRFAGLETLALYEMAYKLVSLPRNAAVSGVQATIPTVTRLMATDRVEASRLYTKSVRIVSLAGAALGLGSVIGSPVVSWMMLGRIDTTLILFVSLLALGFFVNTIGAPAFTLGMATGQMRNNIFSSFLTLILMVASYLLFSSLSVAWPLVAAVAMGLAFGGIFVKWRNEKFLDT